MSAPLQRLARRYERACDAQWRARNQRRAGAITRDDFLKVAARATAAGNAFRAAAGIE